MTLEEDKEKLVDARAKIAEVYESQVNDNNPDNGNLSNMNDAILKINNAIANIEKEIG